MVISLFLMMGNYSVCEGMGAWRGSEAAISHPTLSAVVLMQGK
jgi:hypothetical protein